MKLTTSSLAAPVVGIIMGSDSDLGYYESGGRNFK